MRSDFESTNVVLFTGTLDSTVYRMLSIQRKTLKEIADEAYIAATSGTFSSSLLAIFFVLYPLANG